jgi:hypothetical protein
MKIDYKNKRVSERRKFGKNSFSNPVSFAGRTDLFDAASLELVRVLLEK